LSAQFNVPDLRVGTLDSLLALSDDLVKVPRLRFPHDLLSFSLSLMLPRALASDSMLSIPCLQSNVFVEGVSHKIRRQIEDLERAGGVESGTLTVDGVPVDTYLTRSAAN